MTNTELNDLTDDDLLQRRTDLQSQACKVVQMINNQAEGSVAKSQLIDDKYELQSDLNAIEIEINFRLITNE